jgi:hypothetical protein
MLGCLDQHNKDLKPGVWTADADLILGRSAAFLNESPIQDTSSRCDYSFPRPRLCDRPPHPHTRYSGDVHEGPLWRIQPPLLLLTCGLLCSQPPRVGSRVRFPAAAACGALSSRGKLEASPLV